LGGCSLVLQLRVEQIAAANGRNVEAVPPKVTGRGTETKGNAQVENKAPTEHTGDWLDGHCEYLSIVCFCFGYIVHLPILYFYLIIKSYQTINSSSIVFFFFN